VPGRTPAEAFRDFIEPIKDVVSCLGAAQVTPSAGGRTEPDIIHAWTINGATGLVFPGGWHFEAQMHYEISESFTGVWRVHTRAYRYRLAQAGQDLFRIHWHPDRVSRYHLPHVHLSLSGTEGSVVTSMKEHLPTGRLTFEDAVEWAVEVGVRPAREDWRDVVAATRDLHVKHRTWSTHPPPSSGPR
jgi:hypothetical protein